jgi:hypothetical protein
MAIAFTKRIPGVRTKQAHYVISGTYTAATDLTAGSAVVPGVSAQGAQDTAGVSTDGAGNLKCKFGFTPDTVKVDNATTRTILTWFRGMAAGDYCKQVAGGTRTLETDSGLLVDTSDTSATRGTVTVTAASAGFTDNATLRVEATEA